MTSFVEFYPDNREYVEYRKPVPFYLSHADYRALTHTVLQTHWSTFIKAYTAQNPHDVYKPMFVWYDNAVHAFFQYMLEFGYSMAFNLGTVYVDV